MTLRKTLGEWMPKATDEQDESAKVSGSLQAPKWLIGTIVMALIGATGAGSYATYRTADATTVGQAEAIAAMTWYHEGEAA